MKVLFVIYRNPRLKTLLLSVILGVAGFVLGYTTYVNELEPVPIYSPE
jgi:hypothetical protein